MLGGGEHPRTPLGRAAGRGLIGSPRVLQLGWLLRGSVVACVWGHCCGGVPGGCHPPPSPLCLGAAKPGGVGDTRVGPTGLVGGVVTPVSPQATPMSPRARRLSWQRHLLAVPPSLETSSLRTGFVKDQHHQAGLGRTGWGPEASFGGLMPLAPLLAPGLTPWLCRQVVTN